MAWAVAPVYEFHYLIDSKQAQDNSSKVTLCPDGSILTLNHFGSYADGEEMTFDGEKVAEGAATTSTSDNRNLLLMKHTELGKKVWAVSSKKGYIDVSSTGNVVTDAEGNVILLLQVRCSDVSPVLNAPVLVDAGGNEIEFPDWNTSANVYNQVLVKLNSDGLVQWTKTIAQDQLPVPHATSGNSVTQTVNGVTPYALATDASGNIYIGGNFRSPMIITGEKNGVYVLQPRNLDTYNGDTQQAAGGAYLVKLDSNGNYASHLKFTGTVTRDQVCALVVEGNTLYFTGNIQGKAEQTVSAGNLSITLDNTLDGLMLGAVNTETFKPDYFKYISATANTAGKHTTQCKGMSYIDGSLYIYGLCLGGFEGYATNTTTMLQGFILKADAATGAVNDGASSAQSIGGYLGAFKYGDNLYFYGYALNGTIGAFLDEYPASGALERTARHTLVKGGGAPTAYSCAFNSKTTRLYTLSRGNNVFTFGDESSAKPESWGGVLGGFYFDKSQTDATESIAADAEAMTFSAAQGTLTVNAPEASSLQVVNAAGQVVVDTTVQAGTSTFTLAPGVYVANNSKVLVP